MRSTAVVAGRAWGLALLSSPWVVDRIAGRPASPLELTAARVLGVRQLAESVALQRFGVRARPWVVAVEGVHAGSMIGLAVADPARRRLALAALTAALVIGGLTLRDR